MLGVCAPRTGMSPSGVTSAELCEAPGATALKGRGAWGAQGGCTRGGHREASESRSVFCGRAERRCKVRGDLGHREGLVQRDPGTGHGEQQPTAGPHWMPLGRGVRSHGPTGPSDCFASSLAGGLGGQTPAWQPVF